LNEPEAIGTVPLRRFVLAASVKVQAPAATTYLL
jgi:hypothetical protein